MSALATSDNESWRSAISSGSYEDLNRFIAPVKEARESGNMEPARMLAKEARRRRYHYTAELGRYVEMKVTKGNNLVLVGWSGGYLFATFTSGPRVYVYESVPQEEFFKLCRSPFPDRLFSTNVKAKYKTKEAV